MADRSNITGLGMVAVAVVSTGVILASYRLIHRRLESNHKLNNTTEKQRESSTAKKKNQKKVRFADYVTAADLQADGDELRRTTGGKLVRPVLRKAAYSSTHLAC